VLACSSAFMLVYWLLSSPFSNPKGRCEAATENGGEARCYGDKLHLRVTFCREQVQQLREQMLAYAGEDDGRDSEPKCLGGLE
jgi:hypothetical protein